MPLARYYRHNLSQEDKDALDRGEMNHNLREWTRDDVRRFQQESNDLFKRGQEEDVFRPVSPLFPPIGGKSTSPVSPVCQEVYFVLANASSHSSQASSRMVSPLSEARQFNVRREVTFDTFLTSHISGKGLAYPGANNATKVQDDGDVGKKTLDKKEKRLSKMPSMPVLRKRKTVMDVECAEGVMSV
ncbi:hypothetical protein EJ04DRAFT_578645 [Polyplosphaeria fusca]|uniref:Uncharacterized protein n=1 Tax=Polyplosphaeria fusca TaxID=682080 RepID=A0A9P4QQR8_9PLEO|nr:hypothetical protein EJ04DRAFT_578645 [Polyplosphaeria fusca]